MWRKILERKFYFDYFIKIVEESKESFLDLFFFFKSNENIFNIKMSNRRG